MCYRKQLVWPVLLIASFASIASAQGLKSVFAAPKAKPVATPTDPLGRQTPRSAISNFLDNCHPGRLAEGAKYLDLSQLSASQRKQKGPDLARDVCTLLNRDPQFVLGRLSNSAAGMPDDELAPGKDLLATFTVNNSAVPLYLQQVNRNKMEVWLVSAGSVSRLPELSPLLQASGVDTWMPAPLVHIRFIGTSVWVWIALIVIALILSFISRLISRGIVSVVERFLARKEALRHRLEHLVEPIRLLIAVMLFRIAMTFLPTSVRTRQYLIYLLGVLFVIAVAAIAMRIVDLASDQILSRLDPKRRAVSYGMFRLSVRFIDVCIFCVAVLFLLHQWGFQIGAILAGLGVGGLAVALAAQKTLENLFGGISIISDRSVVVGEFYLFNGPRGIMVGTIEEVGLRSTRIRTLFRTIVTIPNASFATMQLENMTVRNIMWFHPSLFLRRDTPPAKIRAMMDAMIKILEDHPLVDPTDVPLRFSAILEQSYQLDIFSYVTSDDYNVYLNVQSELLLKFLQAGEELGVSFAVPFYEIIPDKKFAEAPEAYLSRLQAGTNGNANEADHAQQREQVPE